jgi:hypothetical protein
MGASLRDRVLILRTKPCFTVLALRVSPDLRYKGAAMLKPMPASEIAALLLAMPRIPEGVHRTPDGATWQAWPNQQTNDWKWEPLNNIAMRVRHPIKPPEPI